MPHYTHYSQFNEMIASWGTVSPWIFPSLWSLLGLFACMRRCFGVGIVLLLAGASDFFLSYLFSRPTFLDGGDTVLLFWAELPKQPVWTVATLLPGAVNISLAIIIAFLVHSHSKRKR
jgi:hypothetical protein